MSWPKRPTYWMDGRTMCVSIPFTWTLPEVKEYLRYIPKKNPIFDKVVVGGPAVQLMPGFFNDLKFVKEGHEYPGALQKVNPFATRTTTGCPNKCRFCGIGKGFIEGEGFQELEDWPDLPIICDNNLLASSIEHFDKVIDRLKVHGWCDFEQGLDARLLNDHHASRFKEIKKPMIRLSLDDMSYIGQWENAFDLLRSAKVAKSHIRSYALIGFNSDPSAAWRRCQWIEKHGIKALPMWYHPLDQLELNDISEEQKALGWNDFERRRIMQWFYFHKKAVVKS
jgi:hypothetical protein